MDLEIYKGKLIQYVQEHIQAAQLVDSQVCICCGGVGTRLWMGWCMWFAGHWWALLDVGGHCWTLVGIAGRWWALLDVGCSNGWTLDVNPHSCNQPPYRMQWWLHCILCGDYFCAWLLLGCMFVTMVESNAGDG